MEPSSKKLKVDENGADEPTLSANLTCEDARKIIETFNQEQLVDIVAEAMCRDEGVLDTVRQIADRDPVQRKLFIRGLGWETTTEKIRSLFSNYGDLSEAVVILDKATGKSKGYGFVTFQHIDGAILALKEPSKKIDGRVTVTQLAAAGPAGSTASAPSTADVSLRKIFVGNVPADMPSDRLLSLFSSYGDIAEGPLGFDKQSGKFKGYAFFVYKTVEAAQAALADPLKSIDGITLQCKLATDGKKGRPGAGVQGVGGLGNPLGSTGADGNGDGLGVGSQSSMPGSFSSQFGQNPSIPGSYSNQFGGPSGGISSYGNFSGSSGFTGVATAAGQHHHMNPPLQQPIGSGNATLSSVGGQAPSSLGGSGVGGYAGGGLTGTPYGSSMQYPGSGGYGGLGMGSSLYRTPAGSAGMPTSGFPEGGQYSSSSSMYQGPHHQPAGSSPGSRVPPGGGMYHNTPHYY